jgi:hypothetical protein
MGVAPNLGGVQLLAFWSVMKSTRHSRRIRPHAKRNASSFVAHERVTMFLFNRPVKIVRCLTHASTVAGSVPEAEMPRVPVAIIFSNDPLSSGAVEAPRS